MIDLPRAKQLAAWLLLAYCVGLTAFGLLFVNLTVDDAYITFRYARTLMETGQWSWNPGHVFQDVEAYTNPLYAALSIPIHAMGLPAVLPFKLLGLLTLCGIFGAMMKGLSPRRKLAASAFVCTNFYVFAHAFSGLETTTFLLLVLATLLADDPDLDTGVFSALILLAPLVRPEGILVSTYILYRQTVRGSWNRWTVVSLAGGLIYLAWRVRRYGLLLPNTFYAKMNGDSSFLANAFDERYLIATGIVSCLVLWRHRRHRLLALSLLLGFVLGNLTADMQMNYLHRYAYHLIVPMSFAAVHTLLQALPSPLLRQPGWQARLMLASMPLLGVLAALTLSGHQVLVMLDYSRSVHLSHKALGKLLKACVPPGPILALEDVGQMAYYSDHVILDYVGLANREITDYLRGAKPLQVPAPDAILLYNHRPDICISVRPYPGQEQLVRQFVTEGRYTCVPGRAWSEALYLNALIRNDSPYAAALTDVMRQSAAAPPISALTRSATLMNAVRFESLREELQD
ncbi:MAG: hypothetical protein QM749_02925 [Aquabacterium sp.]